MAAATPSTTEMSGGVGETASTLSASSPAAAAAAVAAAALNVPTLPLAGRVLATLALSACGLASLLGNAVTCHVILHSRRLQSTTNYFVIALSTTAMLYVACLAMALADLAVADWRLGDPACRLAGVLLHGLLACNACLLASVQADRFYAIVRPLASRISRAVAKHLIGASGAAGLVAALPMAAFYGQQRAEGGSGGIRQVCGLRGGGGGGGDWPSLALYLAPFVGLSCLLPCLASLALMGRVWGHVWTISQQQVGGLRGGRMLHRTANQVPRAKVKTFKLMAAVTLADLLAMCLSLALVLGFLGFQLAPAPGGAYDPLALAASIYSLAGLSKPVLYASMNASFRRGCREVLCWSKQRVYRQELYTVTSVSVFSKRNYVTAVDATNGMVADSSSHWESPVACDGSGFDSTRGAASAGCSSARTTPIGRHGNVI